MTTDLHTIQRSLATLWTRESARDDLISGRQPDGVASDITPIVDRRGVALYASLINIGHQDLMKSIYPGCSKLLSRSWTKLVKRYMETCPPDHYNLNAAAKGFSQFLIEHCPEIVTRHPFMPDLADYEWIELEIMERDGKPEAGEKIGLDNPETFQKYGPVLNSILVVRRYRYPISKIVDWLKDDIRLPRRVKREPVVLAIYRDPDELYARFIELGNLAANVLEKLAERQHTYAELLKFAVSESKGADPQETVMQSIELFEQLNELNVLLGSKSVQ